MSKLRIVFSMLSISINFRWFIFYIICCFPVKYYSQVNDSISLKINYLAKNNYPIDDTNTVVPFMDSKVYIIGENHSEKTSLRLELAVFKKLKKVQNVNVLLWEFAPSNEYLINYYFRTKNNFILYKNKKVKFFRNSLDDGRK